MERFTTSIRFHTWYEHWHRYYFVKDLVAGKKVCDIACGEGYGTHLLSKTADSIVGVDIDNQTILDAKTKYNDRKNLNYIQANATNTPFPNQEFDIIISFETIEHLHQQEELLAEFKRILKPNGLLVISTPDKNIYSEMSNSHNHYHVKELSKHEFSQLIDKSFSYSHHFGQQFQLYSSIFNVDNYQSHAQNNCLQFVQQGNEHIAAENTYPAQYLITLCSNQPLSIKKLALPNSHHFADSNNSLYEHYEQQIKRLIQLEQQNQQLQDMLSKQNNIINYLKSRLGL